MDRFTSNRDESASNLKPESYAPSQNMFQSTDTRGLMEKEALSGEIQVAETCSSTMICIVLYVDVLGFHSSAWRVKCTKLGEKNSLSVLIWCICPVPSSLLRSWEWLSAQAN